MPTPASLLKETFGYDDFRPLQREVIENVLARRDTLAVMPTGGGKSLCYQIPSLLFEGLTVVVSPLIALMKDQVEQLRAYGVPALFLNSSLSPQEYQENMDYVKRGEVIVRQGDTGSSMFVIKRARVRVVESSGRELATIEPGGYVGEMSMLTGQPRSATVLAVGDCDAVIRNLA